MHRTHVRALNLRALDVRLLLAFEALLDEGSISRAAERVALSQPAMSRTLARLRRVFGDPLFRRERGRLLPTGRALELAPAVATALDALAVLRAGPRFDPATCRAPLRIATTEYGMTLLLPQILRRLAREAPQMRIQVLVWNDATLDELRMGQIDLALGVPHLTGGGLRSEPLFEDVLLCLLRRSHPLARRRKLSVEDYVAYPHVVVATGAAGATTGIDAALDAQGQTRSVVLRVPSFLAAATVAAHTDMMLTTPARLARLFGAALPLVLRSPPLALPPIVYRQIWSERLHDSPLHVWLRGLLRQLTLELPAASGRQSCVSRPSGGAELTDRASPY